MALIQQGNSWITAILFDHMSLVLCQSWQEETNFPVTSAYIYQRFRNRNLGAAVYSPSKVTFTFVFFSAFPIKAIISWADLCSHEIYSIHFRYPYYTTVVRWTPRRRGSCLDPCFTDGFWITLKVNGGANQEAYSRLRRTLNPAWPRNTARNSYWHKICIAGSDCNITA